MQGWLNQWVGGHPLRPGGGLATPSPATPKSQNPLLLLLLFEGPFGDGSPPPPPPPPPKKGTLFHSASNWTIEEFSLELKKMASQVVLSSIAGMAIINPKSIRHLQQNLKDQIKVEPLELQRYN
jgi:hypothetical protein